MRINSLNSNNNIYTNKTVNFSKKQKREYTPATVSNTKIDTAMDALSSYGIALLNHVSSDKDCHLKLSDAENEIDAKGFKIYCESKDLKKSGESTLDFIDFSLKDLDVEYTDIIQEPFIYSHNSDMIVAQALTSDPETILFFEVEQGKNSPLYFAKNGQITSVAVNADNSNGGLKADKVYNFKNGQLKSYYEDYVTDNKGNEKKGREFIFEDSNGAPVSVQIYNEGVETNGKKTTVQQSAKLLHGSILGCTKIFNTGKLSQAQLFMSFFKRSADMVFKKKKLEQDTDDLYRYYK